MIFSRARIFVFVAATIVFAAPVLTSPAAAQTYKIVNASNKAQSFVVECTIHPKQSLTWIARNCTRVQTTAKGGNVEFEWKVEEGE